VEVGAAAGGTYTLAYTTAPENGSPGVYGLSAEIAFDENPRNAIRAMVGLRRLQIQPF
jgi:hypothetical protein